jgi:hypothetical protein
MDNELVGMTLSSSMRKSRRPGGLQRGECPHGWNWVASGVLEEAVQAYLWTSDEALEGQTQKASEGKTPLHVCTHAARVSENDSV